MAVVRWESGRVLAPSAPGSEWWDSKCISGAVVAKDPMTSSYRMYYYGRGGDTWNMGIKPFNASLPTGRVGLALSTDGVNFTRHRGHLPGGAVLDPTDDNQAFDCVHVAVSDAVHASDTWRLYYLGGGLMDAVPGLPILPGVALSPDGLQFFERHGPLLRTGPSGDWDEKGISWPRLFTGPTGQSFMTYHSFEPSGFFSAGMAVSDDGGFTWEKMGKVLSRGGPGAWDEGGVSVRHVISMGPNEYVMFYEGSTTRDDGPDFAIGLAVSKDGVRWRKDDMVGDEPGGPVLRARRGIEVWDNFIVGTPYVVATEGGELRMYYLGVGKKSGEDDYMSGIGLALSHVSNYRSWRRYDG